MSGAATSKLGATFAASGLPVFAPDIRGHGQSGERGDIAYIGQLEDDMEDLLDHVAQTFPDRPVVMAGHSLGGGYALRIAGSRIGGRFKRFILLAPFLGKEASVGRRHASGLARVAIPRIVALEMLNDINSRIATQPAPTTTRPNTRPRSKCANMRAKPTSPSSRGRDMAKGYWIVRGDVTDAEAYKAYVAANAEAFGKYGARFLVRGDKSVLKEGGGRARNVVIEFADFDTAVACYDSPEYARAMAFRKGAAELDVVVVEGA